MGLLSRIEISGLFGHYSYNLPLYNGQRKNICFLTGPNGYGKSTILRLIYAFMKADARTLVNIPYDMITFYLKDYKVVLQQERIEEEMDVNSDSSSSDDDVPIIKKLSIIVYDLEGNQELERFVFEDNGLEVENVKVFPQNLSVYLASVYVEYIADDRLLPGNADKLGVTDCVGFLQRLMAQYDEHLTALYNDCLLDAMRSSSFEDFSPDRQEEKGLLKRTDSKLTAFNNLGLATKLIDKNLPGEKHFLMVLQMRAVDKVLSFDDLFYKRLSLLYDIITRSDFSDKRLVLDTKYGLYFISDETIIIPEELSSGEQHFIIQLITLAMKAEAGSLILIDEPELSYHPAWQLDYLKNLRRIAELGEYQFILATHSAQIFDYKWNYTIDLYKQTTKDAEGIETNHQTNG